MASSKQDLLDSLTCPICKDLLSQPKLLPCSHTFCESCLFQLHTIQALGDRITCSVCRGVAPLSNNDVSNFPTNQIAKSLVEDFREHQDKKTRADTADSASFGQCCTVCNVEDQGIAVYYCQNCAEFLCNSCLEQHNKFKQNAFHELVNAADIVTEEVKKQNACLEHPRELQQFVCITCLVRVCCRCMEVSHQSEKHDVIGIEEYEESHKAALEFMEKSVEQKAAVIQSQSSYVKEQINKVKSTISKQKQEIEKAYDDAAKSLKQRKLDLLEECHTYERALCTDLEDIVKCNDEVLKNLSTKVSEVKENSSRKHEDISLSKRVSEVAELETIIQGDTLDTSVPESIAKRAELLSFHPDAGSSHLALGTVQVNRWALRAAVGFDGGISCSAATPDGQLAIATRNGEIKLFSGDGELQHTQAVVRVRGLGFLSDGRCVVRQTNNNVNLYSTEWEECNEVFETLTKDDAGVGGLSIDSYDRIYIDYRSSKRIQVFAPAGGPAEKDIPCHGFEPWHVSVIGSGTNLLTLSHSNSVRIIDDKGEKKHLITKPAGTYIHPSICRDGTILLACMDHSKGVFNIERYTSDLYLKETLVADQWMENPNGKWCYLQELTDSKVALCTTDKLYFYRKLF